MNGDKEKGFSFSYSAPTEEEKREVASIQREYLPVNRQDKIERIRNLDKKVKRAPTVISLTVGIVGTLILGVGMTMVLEWEKIFGGITVGFTGAIILSLAYPIRSVLYKKNKRKYSQEILNLADEILGEEEKRQ